MVGESVLVNLITKVIVGLAGQIFRKDDKLLTEVKKLTRALPADPSVGTVLQKALSSFARELKGDKKTVERLRTFLVSPEVEAIVRQAFALRLSGISGKTHSELRNIFDSEFEQAVGTSDPQLLRELFDSIVDACDSALSQKLEWVVPKESTRLVVDEVSAIAAKRAFLSAGRYDRELIFEFEAKYRKQVGIANKHIVPPDMNVSRKVPVDKLYVASDIVPVRRRKGEDVRQLGLDHFLRAAYRAVILGNPGAGKSTLAKKLCHDLATHFESRPFANRQLTPIIVTVRDYGSEKKNRSCSIVEFLELKTKSDYQLPTPPTGFFEYLFHHGLALVIFDGLDELLDTSDRQKVSADVELFTNLYPSVPVLVTSREVGYEQAPLDERFEAFRISPFDDEQVESYVTKWFALNTDLAPNIQKQKTAAFLQESMIVPDLRSNPLMLALMCNIYRGEGYIPRNRPDVYKKCAEMLFEKWDKGRGIHYQLPFEAHIRPAMHHLAHWIYSGEGLQGGVAEDALIQEAANYLEKWFESRAEAESASQKFIEFCRGRAWVFTDTGTTKGGEKLYQFTHRTFLEYFTALHICQTHRSPHDIGNLLHSRIKKREWDIVSQLTYQLKGSSFVGDTDPLLLGVLDVAPDCSIAEQWNQISFVVRCLQFMVPTPPVRRRIVRELFRLAIEFGVLQSSKDERTEVELPAETIGDLLLCAEDNRATVAEEIKEYLCSVILTERDANALVAYEVGTRLTFASDALDRNLVGTFYEFWEKVSREIAKAGEPKILSLAPNNFSGAMDCIWKDLVTIEEFVNWHGTSALFKGVAFKVFPHSGMSSIATSLLSSWYTRDRSDEKYAAAFERRARLLGECGKVLGRKSPPWIDRQVLKTFGPHLPYEALRGDFRSMKPKALELQPGALFGFALLLATLLEPQREKLDKLRPSQLEYVAPLVPLLRARASGSVDSSVEASLVKLGLSEDQRQLLLNWSRGIVNFCGDSVSLFSKAITTD